MIVLKKLIWSNFFSYGDNNSIILDSNELTQLSGVNGAGKSSIPLVLEELLYGKNSKGIKKADISNRYTNKPLEASIYFSINNDEYEVHLKRKSTLSVKLLKNSKDISSHTATATMAQLEEILGLDFKTFSQLIYQSSTSSLQFLTATDTNRKKFLVSLFNLDRYVEIHEHFKALAKTISINLASIEGSVKTIQSWINKNEHIDTNTIPECAIPLLPTSYKENLTELEISLRNIQEKNKAINKNNEYKRQLGLLKPETLTEKLEKPSDDIDLINRKLGEFTSELSSITKTHTKLKGLHGICPTCMQEIDNDKHKAMLDEAEQRIASLNELISRGNKKAQEVKTAITKYNNYISKIDEVEKLMNYIDESIPEEILSKEDIEKEILIVKSTIASIQSEIDKAIKHNKEASSHNSRIEVITSQLKEHREQLEQESVKLQEVSSLLNKVEILKKSFSTTGLLSFKIEYLVKDLEDQINNYLTELSAGRFQLIFQLQNDKLNIEIVDNGNSVTVDSLSAGERARVNLSTLLAIRKLMSAISATKINTLFLDEVLGVIDSDGKDKLVEVLMKEKDLNTFIVDHTWSHPLVPTIYVTKENNISSLSME